jgi:amidase
MTATTADNALLLEVIAGADGLDPRQYAPLTAPYTEALSGGVESLRIGVLEEGFGQEKSEPDVDAKVHAAAQVLRELGATVEDVSIPMHSLSIALWVVVATEGSIATMMRGNGFGTNWRGLYLTSLLDRHAAWRSRIDEVNTGFKIRLVMAEYLARAYRGRYYAKAQNLSRKLKAAYDEAFERFDLLLLPTSAIKATRLPGPNASLSEAMAPGLDPVTNTAAFNLTGHPALSIPCAMSAGLPVGLQLVARYYDEATIYRASQAFEEATDWKSL